MAPRSFVAAAALAGLISSASALYINGSVTAPCDSPLYCHGEILKAIELAHPFTDSKTFVDMPTIRPLDEVIAAFNRLSQPLSNNSELNAFLAANFAPAGGELEAVPRDQLHTEPSFLNKLDDTVIKEFVAKVIDIWPDLTRRYGGPGNCTACANSFIPVNRTFVVAGGRFREPYYWDSYWILEGLLRTGGAFTEISKNIIENFLDFVETIGFIPNGARIYYLDRSQPPLLARMVRSYVDYTNDTSILDRALPLLIKEHEFWSTNRSVSIKAPNGKTYTLNRYYVNNNQPRPESFREDYITANNGSYYAASGIIYPVNTPLNDTEKAELYANLASGAETGWDYSTRWLKNPNDAAKDIYFPLRSLNVRGTVPVDLNSILYENEVIISQYLKRAGNNSEAERWAYAASQRSEAMFELMWNATHWSYFDYNLTSNSQRIFVPVDDDATAAERAGAPRGQQVLFNIGQFYPFWTGAAPAQLKNNPLAVQQAYARVARMLDENAGGIPATNFVTGQQWDQPNVWPPLQHVLMEGLLNTPPTFGDADPAYQSVRALALRLAQRYLDSTFCTWYATGGSTSQTPQLQGVAPGAEGIMFEKYADNSTNVAGSGGEYEVVEGFGWSNGVLIWAADVFGAQLKRPDCGNITAAHTSGSGAQKRSGGSLARRAVELDPWDAAWTKMFGRSALKKREDVRKRWLLAA
ncbi:9fd4d0db-228e-4fe1-8548-bea1feac3ea8 [Thermothielavioides terrestris]|uniref:Trehalase n=2 Tax=Thermothielavioides terrestris TaxID=2587410 RepID=G2RDT9_THETT|nr:glycoside hydrolase family 37 protein [Thermothielavioides terrestris NRRL 8126]AEO70020.1 glycoside hydrolase family 37 protein [Thermothielavioides terrestris NRRL 8126]SPQ17815.1 9fd4d0db-228e-4fe1-8548-bea1feac3ea8 [Thermothielavioides terrestris]